ncbi:MAG: hypothetical protein ACE5GV_12960, partial [Candidatus Scalindua sp.]
NNAVQQMDQVTQGNAASAEETASASEEMSAQAESLVEQIGILASLVGGKGDGVSQANDEPLNANRPHREYSGQIDHRDKGANRPVQKGISGKIGNGNGNGGQRVSTKTDPEAVIPMGENRIIEHGEHMNDF